MTPTAITLARTSSARDADEFIPPPPHNIEAEQCLLGAILVNNEAIYRVADFLDPGHFFEPLHQHIYDIARSLIRIGKLASPITLKTFLPVDVDIAGMTVARYLARLAAEATTIINARDYAEIIKDLFDRRQIIMIADDMRAAAETSRPASEVAGIGIDCLDEIVASHAVSHTAAVDIDRAATDAVEKMTCAMQRGGAIGGIPTGLKSLDRKTDGLHRGELVIWAGRPGMGKTGAALSCALKTAAAGFNVLFFSLEMGATALGDRVLSDLVYRGDPDPLTYYEIAGGLLSGNQAEAVVEASRTLRGLPLRIEQQSGLTISQIAARARKRASALARKNKTLDVVYIDHAHIVKPSDRYRGNRVGEITEISGALKVLAKDLNVAVVALCQLNRSVETRDDKRPNMSDLRDSGSIEQDADVIVLLYREAYYLSRPSPDPATEDRRIARLFDVRNKLELDVAKQRSGPTGPVKIFFDCAANAARDLDEGR